MSTFLCLCILLLLLFDCALANTEIINFSASKDSFVLLPFTETWPTLRLRTPNIQVNVTSAVLGSVLPQTICAGLDKWHPERPRMCPHELWVVLDLDEVEWKDFDKFTLRLSWAAFHPTDISMKIYDPTALTAFATPNPAPSKSSKTRRKYARIQMVHTGVLTPTSNELDDVSRYTVPIFLILEPLKFSVLPQSVIPVVFAIIAAIVIGLLVAGKINNYFQSIIQQAKKANEPRPKIS